MCFLVETQSGVHAIIINEELGRLPDDENNIDKTL